MILTELLGGRMVYGKLTVDMNRRWYLCNFQRRYVADGNLNNFHWKPQRIQTQACAVQFDFIGKFENLMQGKFSQY